MDIPLRILLQRPQSKLWILALFIYMACALDGISSVSASDVNTQISKLLQENKSSDAYELAKEYEPSSAGDPSFDFYYGLAAIAVGHVNEATFAFERVLVVAPDNDRARLELARAYFLQENYLMAKQEFDVVLSHSPPNNVKRRVEEYLANIDKRLRQVRWEGSASVGLAVGHDTNVNSATHDSTITVPALNEVTLDPNSTASDDEFVHVDGVGHILYKANRQSIWFADVNLSHRDNATSNAFDTTAMTGQFGPVWSLHGAMLSIPITGQRLYLDGSPLRNLGAIGLNWTRRPQSKLPLSLYGQRGAVRYASQEQNDVDYWMGGLALSHSTLGMTSLTGTVFYGSEVARLASAESHGRHYWGGRAGIQKPVGRRVRLDLSANGQVIDHAAVDPVFLVTRHDKFLQISAELTLKAAKHLEYFLTLDSLMNDSNIALYEYDRTMFSGGINYVW